MLNYKEGKSMVLPSEQFYSQKFNMSKQYKQNSVMYCQLRFQNSTACSHHSRYTIDFCFHGVILKRINLSSRFSICQFLLQFTLSLETFFTRPESRFLHQLMKKKMSFKNIYLVIDINA